MIEPEPNHLFVYGTLMRGGKSPYAQLLQARARFVGEATISGRLYNLGRYPGAIPDEGCNAKVFGEVFRLSSSALLDSLDRFEGCHASDPEPHAFRRDAVRASLVRGGAVDAWVYAFAGNTAGRPLIATGRFLSA